MVISGMRVCVCVHICVCVCVHIFKSKLNLKAALTCVTVTCFQGLLLTFRIHLQ